MVVSDGCMCLCLCLCPCRVSDPEAEDHTRLLVEPVAVPEMGHTGVKPNVTTASTTGERPLFYPNGSRNLNLRASIRKSLRAPAESYVPLPSAAASTRGRGSTGRPKSKQTVRMEPAASGLVRPTRPRSKSPGRKDPFAHVRPRTACTPTPPREVTGREKEVRKLVKELKEE